MLVHEAVKTNNMFSSLTQAKSAGGAGHSTVGGGNTTTATSNGGSKKKNRKKKSKSKLPAADPTTSGGGSETCSATSNNNQERAEDSAQLPLARRLEVAAAIPDTHAALVGLLGWSRLYVHSDTILTFFESDALALLLTNVLQSRPPAAVFENLSALLANCLAVEVAPELSGSSTSAMAHLAMADEIVAAVRTIADELHGAVELQDTEAERAARALSRIVCTHALSLHGVELGSPLTHDVQQLETQLAEAARADEAVRGQTIRDSFHRRDLRSDALKLHEERLRTITELVDTRVQSAEQHQQADDALQDDNMREEDAKELNEAAQGQSEMEKVSQALQKMRDDKDAELAPLRARKEAAVAEVKTLRQRREELEAQLRAVEDNLQRATGAQQQVDDEICAAEERHIAETARFRAEHEHVAQRFTQAQQRRVIATEVTRVEKSVRQAQLEHSQVHALRTKQASCLTQQLEATLNYFESELPCVKFMLARMAENETQFAPLRDEASRYRALGVSAVAKELEDKATALEDHLQEDKGCLSALRVRDVELLEGMRAILTDSSMSEALTGLDERLVREVQRMIDYVSKLYDLPPTDRVVSVGGTSKGAIGSQKKTTA